MWRSQGVLLLHSFPASRCSLHASRGSIGDDLSPKDVGAPPSLRRPHLRSSSWALAEGSEVRRRTSALDSDAPGTKRASGALPRLAETRETSSCTSQSAMCHFPRCATAAPETFGRGNRECLARLSRRRDPLSGAEAAYSLKSRNQCRLRCLARLSDTQTSLEDLRMSRHSSGLRTIMWCFFTFVDIALRAGALVQNMDSVQGPYRRHTSEQQEETSTCRQSLPRGKSLKNGHWNVVLS